MKSSYPFAKGTGLVVALLVISGTRASVASAQNYLTVLKNASDHARLTTISETAATSASSPTAVSSPMKGGGSIEIFRERYPSGEVRIEREVTLDSEGNYVNHGAWKMWDPAGLLIADGQYNMGKRIGSWTRILGRRDTEIMRQAPFSQFKAPFTSNVTFSNDQMNGDWLIVDADQKKCSQVSLANGQRHGMAITWLANGNVLRQAQYDQGVPVGDVLQANSSTGELERAATYLDGRRITSNVEYYTRAKRQQKSEEMFLAPKTEQKTADDFWNCQFATYDHDGEACVTGWPRRGTKTVSSNRKASTSIMNASAIFDSGIPTARSRPKASSKATSMPDSGCGGMRTARRPSLVAMNRVAISANGGGGTKSANWQTAAPSTAPST